MINEENTVYLHNGELFNHKEEWNDVIPLQANG
jgi:hypothetical protein